MSRKITRELTPPALREGPECSRCDSTGWVCENHSDRPWDGEKACSCGDPGPPATYPTQTTRLDFRGAFNETRVSTTTEPIRRRRRRVSALVLSVT